MYGKPEHRAFGKPQQQQPAAGTAPRSNPGTAAFNTAYGRPAHTAYGKPAHTAYGKPVHTAYGKPVPAAYGKPVHKAYGTVVTPERQTSNPAGSSVPRAAYGTPARAAYGTAPRAAAARPRPAHKVYGSTEVHKAHAGYRKPETYAYKESKFQSDLTVAEPYYITKMMYQGLLERLAQARGAIERGDLAVKATKLASAAAIIENLKTSLDFSLKPSLAQNFSDLYDFMLYCINKASFNLSSKPIDDAIKVLLPIKTAWEKIPVKAIEEANKMRRVDRDYSNNSSMLAAHV